MRLCSTVMVLACALTVSGPITHAQSPLHLIPVPRQLVRYPDQPLTNGVSILCSACDSEDAFTAVDLRQTLAARGISVTDRKTSSLRIVLHRLADHPDSSFTEAMHAEGYTIAYTHGTLTLTGATSAGLFYAAQTAKQLIQASGTADDPITGILHPADIHDWPAMRYRGLHDDLSRGPVDTLDFQMKLIRTLATYKVNIYSPYFENTQQYASNPLAAPPEGSVSAEDARQLVAYAAKYHITVIPEQEAFGHLRKMLVWETYADLAETPHGAVLSPGQPGTLPLIDQMFTELAGLYPGPFLHIGGDETFDLGYGRTGPAVQAQGLATVYLDFLQRIVTGLEPLHRKILFWGDIAQDAPDQLKALPPAIKHQLIAVAWGYSPNPKGFKAYLKPYTEAGIQTWVAPAINNYRQVWPNQQLALEDIQEFTRDGQRYGATGQLNTLWNDDGESLANMNWYGILFGAACAWQPGESSIPAFQQSYAQVFHGDSTGLLNQAQDELTSAMALLHDAKVISATEGSDGLFWVDPWSPDGVAFGDKMRPINSALRLDAEHALTLIAQARAAEPDLREPEAISAMEFGARRIDFLGLKFQLADEMAASYNAALSRVPTPFQINSKPAAQASAQAGTPATVQSTPPPAAPPSPGPLAASQNAAPAMPQANPQSTPEATPQVTAQPSPAPTAEPLPRPSVSAMLSDINGVNGRLQDIIDTYSELRDLYAQQWNSTYRTSGLRPILEHYDYTIGLWYARVDKVRSAQRQWHADRTLPPAAELGIPVLAPAPAPAVVTPQPTTPTHTTNAMPTPTPRGGSR